MTPEEILQESRFLRQELGGFSRRSEWLRHPDAGVLRQRLQRLLDELQEYGAEGGHASGVPTRPVSGDSGTLRYVSWNILHGCDHERVLEALSTDPALRHADLVALNEVDIGMQRSGNIDVGRFLAERLGLHGVWCALFLELRGGEPASHPPRPLDADREALFGLCLLSRYPLTNARRLVLETPADLLFDGEGKVGDFVALEVTVQHPHGPFRVVVTHLDVHGSPARRARQMRQILDTVPDGPMILSGDLNTTTFARGSLGRTLRAFATLVCLPRAALDRRLQRPDEPGTSPRESLFRELRHAGFDWTSCNDGRETLDLLLKDVQEVQRLPPALRALGRPLLRHVERRTRHRLDWIAARGLEAVADPAPRTRPDWMRGERPASDHAPIVCTFRAPVGPFRVAEPTRR